MTDAEQITRIRDILRPVLGKDAKCHNCDGTGHERSIWKSPCATCPNSDGTGTRDVVDGLSVEDAVRRAVEMVRHMPTNQDLLDAAVDAQSRTDKYAKMMLELEAERDAARAAVAEMQERAAAIADACARERADAASRSPVVGPPERSQVHHWLRCKQSEAERIATAIRALHPITKETR